MKACNAQNRNGLKFFFGSSIRFDNVFVLVGQMNLWDVSFHNTGQYTCKLPYSLLLTINPTFVVHIPYSTVQTCPSFTVSSHKVSLADLAITIDHTPVNTVVLSSLSLFCITFHHSQWKTFWKKKKHYKAALVHSTVHSTYM